MILSQLEAFVYVVRHKSFSLAAKHLFLSQPTVSLKVKELEKSLGVTLLARSTKAVTPTAIGSQLYPYARKIISLKNHILEETESLKSGNTGSVTIAVSSTPAQHFLPPVLVDVAERFPNTRFDILRSDSAQVVDDVLSGVAEIGVSGSWTKQASLLVEKLFDDRLVVVTPTTDLYRKLKAPLTADDFRRLPFVGREEGSGTRQWMIGYLATLGLNEGDLNRVATLPGNEHVLAAVRAGLGMSVVSGLAVGDDVKNKKVLVFPVEDGAPERAFYLIKNRKREPSPLAAVCIEALKRFTASLSV
ncbi:MAG TPA: LysR family transcriptional regulator [Fastidiosipila sp.]|nr:LysR family transcriptional regulator [Fastidiosipila sp.]